MSNKIRRQRVTRPDTYAVPFSKVFEVISSESLANVVTWAMNWNRNNDSNKSYEPWADPVYSRR
jgi:hypothetical protein